MFLTVCQKKFSTDCFWGVFGQFWGKFWQILAIFGIFSGIFVEKIDLFPQLIGFFLGGQFFFSVRTVNSDWRADLSVVHLEMTTIRHDGRVYGSIRQPLPQSLFSMWPKKLTLLSKSPCLSLRGFDLFLRLASLLGDPASWHYVWVPLGNHSGLSQLHQFSFDEQITLLNCQINK